MATAASLLDRMTGASSEYGPLLLSLGELFTGLARSFWVSSTPVEPDARSPASCRVVGSDQVAAFRFTGDEGWTDYDEIRRAFEVRNRQGRHEGSGAKSGPLPEELVRAGARLILRDRDDPLECLVAAGPVYPRRAWVGALHPNLGSEMPYVLAGVLNSTLGLVLYHRVRHSTGTGSGHELRKSALSRLRVPWLTYDTEAFRRAALLSYRLHCLYAAGQELSLPASVYDEDIPNHRMRLLSELVRLYGFDDTDGREIVERVLPEGAADVLGAQQNLFYRPKEPLEPIQLRGPGTVERYEALKARARTGGPDPAEAKELTELQALLRWERLANSPVPTLPAAKEPTGAPTAESALRLANRHAATLFGQSVVSVSAVRISSSLWEVQLAPSGRPSPRRIVRNQAPPERPSPGKLWVNAVTGRVSEDPRQAHDAFASGT
jgi:hypothetical protein